jgi:tape measure domain-containing protein
MSLKDLIAKVKLDTDEAKAAIDDLHTHMVRSFDAQEQYATSINSLMTQGFLTQAEGTKILDKLAAGETHLEKALISRMGLAKMTSRVFETATKRWMAIESAAVRQIGVEAEITQRKLIGMSAAKSSSPPASGGSGSGGGGGVNFVRVAATAGQLAVLSKVSTTMKQVGSSVEAVGRTSARSLSYMDNFRFGLQAVEVNPNLNLVKNSFDAIGAGAGKLVDTVRGVADAILSDLPGAASAAVGAMGSVDSALESATATAAKHVSKLETMQKGLSLLSTVFPFAAESISKIQGPLGTVTAKAQQVAEKVQSMQQTVGTAAADMRAKTYVMTGNWTELSGTTDIFARSQWAALLPHRLLVREVEGAQRVVKVATHAFNLLTHPIHAVAVAVSKSRAEWQDLNNRLPKVESGLQLTTRAHRLLSKTAFIAATALKPLITETARQVVWTAKLTIGATRLAFAGLRPVAKAASGVAGAIVGMTTSVAGGILKIVGLGTVAGVTAGMMTKMGSAGNAAGVTINSRFTVVKQQVSGAVDGMVSKLMSLRTVALGAGVGLLAIGTSTAIATEKNNAVFGVMLKDMEAGKAVVGSLQKTEAAKLFDNQELLDSGRLLFKAGISAGNVADKTNQLATIAAATSTELGDLARIYQQGASTGSFGQDKINQFAERGIDIYHALEAATGQHGAALQKMISDGKIGTAEMDAAFANMTEGTGIYAGALETLGNTTAGKWKTIQNNITQALGGVMGVALEILAPFGTVLVTISEQVAGAFGSFRPHIMYAAVAGAWFFGNIVDIGRFAWASLSLFAVTAFNDIIYFFTDKIPAYLSWFSANWKQVFVDAGNLILTVFTNIAKNIGSAMTAIWDYIASGGTTELKFAFVPLLDGFKATVSELPNIPERAMTELEKSLQAQTEGIGVQLGDNFDSMLKDAEKKMAKQAPELSKDAGKAAADGAGTATDEAAKNASKKMAENKAAQINSSEGQSVVAQMLKGLKGDDDKSAKKAAIKSEKHLEKLARNSDRGKPLAAREWKA